LNLKNCEKKGNSTAELVIEANTEEFEVAIGKSFMKNRGHITVSGFRKGKAPRKIIEKVYGATIFHNDAFEALLPGVLEYAENDSGLRLVGQPEITDVSVMDNNAGVSFTMTVSYYPEITLGEYKGLSVSRPLAEVLESDIDASIEETRKRNARIEKVDRPAIDGDVAIIDFEGFMGGNPFQGGKGKDHELTIGAGELIPGFDEGIIGMKAGEVRELELVFPEDYEKQYAGKDVLFKVRLNEVRECILPDVDDEFTMDVSEFDTLEEYRESIREGLQKAKQADSDAELEDALFEMITDSFDVDIPDVLVEEEMDKAMNSFSRQIASIGLDPVEYLKMRNTTPDEYRESLRPVGMQRAKVNLALERIADLEGIEASPEDIEAEYVKAAESSGKDISKLKESVPEKTVARSIKIRLASKLVIDSAAIGDS